jgi:predicted RecA/RadA family phage recombinase
MSQTFVQQGDVVEYTAPTGGVVVDVPLLISSVVVVPLVTAAQTVRFNAGVKGIFKNMPKATGSAWVEGQVLYWDSTAGNFATAQSATARRAASAVLAAASGDTVGTVRLENISAAVNVA